MVESTYTFLSGGPIKVGSHGEHAYVYHSGDPVLDNNGNAYVFESGTAIGEELAWSKDEAGETVVIGSNPRIRIEVDGSGPAQFPVAYRDTTLPSPPWEISWGSADWTRNSEENNFQFGATENTSSRLFGRPDNATIEYGQLDPTNPDAPGDFLRIFDLNGDKVAEEFFSPIGFDDAVSMTLRWRNSEAWFIVDGEIKARASYSFSSPPNFRGGVEVEDDHDSEQGETLTVDGYGEREL